MGYITNLKETWALVTSWHIDLLSELQKFFTGSDRNTNYRNAMKEISPGIPLLYRIKGDVRKLSEFRKNQDDLPAPVFDPLTKTDEKFIDMLMFEGLRKTFHEIEHCYILYNFPKPPNDAIDLWIRHSIRSHKGKKTEDYINKYMDLSIRREPRAPHMLKPKKSWLNEEDIRAERNNATAYSGLPPPPPRRDPSQPGPARLQVVPPAPQPLTTPQPGPSAPGPSQPGPSQPGRRPSRPQVIPVAAQPGPSQPGPSRPQVVSAAPQPGPSAPGPSKPGRSPVQIVFPQSDRHTVPPSRHAHRHIRVVPLRPGSL
ncbi:hypothetical protein C8Q75DRAFT_764750 [Abortiporus biennis]|nr:hypothetical protein C8Q75DRAFT_764750 [Abortiporus biennis]